MRAAQGMPGVVLLLYCGFGPPTARALAASRPPVPRPPADMLTDSGVNAMSDQQQAAMMVADDSYAGSATYTRLWQKLEEIMGFPYFLPCHQARPAPHPRPIG